MGGGLSGGKGGGVLASRGLRGGGLVDGGELVREVTMLMQISSTAKMVVTPVAWKTTESTPCQMRKGQH